MLEEKTMTHEMILLEFVEVYKPFVCPENDVIPASFVISHNVAVVTHILLKDHF